jgi:uncharacterized protein YcbX
VNDWIAVGHVVALYRHPIKSMAAQPLARVTIDRYGIAGDRRFALRRRGDQSGFPWLTASKLPALIRYEVCCASGDSPSRDAMHVHSPNGEFVSCEGDEISMHFAERHGVDVELAHLEQGTFDLAGLSVITTQTLASVGVLVAMPMDARRFRPNVVVEVDSDGEAFPEDAWVGSSLKFGDPASGPCISVSELDERCVMINFDPDGGPASTTIHRTVVRERNNYAGVYAVPTRVGALAVGDVAFVREPRSSAVEGAGRDGAP